MESFGGGGDCWWVLVWLASPRAPPPQPISRSSLTTCRKFGVRVLDCSERAKDGGIRSVAKDLHLPDQSKSGRRKPSQPGPASAAQEPRRARQSGSGQRSPASAASEVPTPDPSGSGRRRQRSPSSVSQAAAPLVLHSTRHSSRRTRQRVG